MHPLSKFTPCGSQTLSKMACRYPEVYPKLLTHGKGGIVYDESSHGFIDLISGLGAISVGYADDTVNAAIVSQVSKGTSFSLPHLLEYQVAKRLTELVPWTEQWKFGKNGTDGTVMAVRAARAFTGRDNILTVGYNGCADVFECVNVRNAGIPSLLKTHIRKARYNDISSFSEINYRDFACVLLEPMVLDEPNEFLNQLRELCDKTGTLLIFDEVVTGGRFDTFTASGHFKVQPDLIVLSKGIANGLPLCAVGGTRRVMSTFERDDFFASGTFGGETVSLAACLATVDILEKAIPQMIWNGSRIKEAFNKLYVGHGICKGYPTRLDFQFTNLYNKYKFWQEMCKRNVLIGYNNFVMANHSDKDVTYIINTMNEIYQILDKVELEGPIPTQAVKK